MVYAAPFHKLVMIGNVYTDVWNMTLSMVPTGGTPVPAVTDDLVEAVGLVVGDWFNNLFGNPNNNGVGFLNVVSLTSVKLNRIGPDGKYMDAEAKEHVFLTPVVGPVVAAIPAQLSLAATFRGVNERARAGRGRIYLPPTTAIAGVGSDGRIPAPDALAFAKGVEHLWGSLNDTYLTEGVPAVLGIASKQGAGAFQGVHQISVGRVVDTIRSRRSKLDEDPQFWGAP